MALTIREKDHWRHRIGQRIRKRIEELIVGQEPGFRRRIEDDARKEVFSTCEASAEFDRLNEIQREQASATREHKHLMGRLEQEEKNIYLQIAKQLNVTDEKEYNSYTIQSAVDGRIGELTRVKVQELMQGDPLGQKVLELENEQDQLLDTVWLATSPSQINELWSKMSDLLEQTPTQLQKDALAIKPMDNDSE